MNKDSIKSYRLDYLVYLGIIIALDICAFYCRQPWLLHISIGIVWLHMCWLALKELKKKRIGTEFFLVFATIVALMGKQELAIMYVLLIMLFARYVELLIEQHTHHAIESLIKLMPSTAIVLEGDKETVVPLEHLMPGMHVLVKTGSRIPADGFIIEGSAAINEAMLTGESIPREKTISNQVFAGTFVERGSIIFKVQKVHQETLFSKMTLLFEQAEKKKAKITMLTNKIALVLVPIILLFIFFVWFVTGNLELVITLLIFGSPLELSLVTPLTVLAGTVAAFRHGILIKGGRALEQLASLTTIIFDKTGTLTLGEPAIVDVQSFDLHYTQNDILKIAAIAELRADHVIAKALLKRARELGLELNQPGNYVSLVGHGVEIILQDKHYFFGNEHFVQAPEHGNSIIPQQYILHQKPYSNYFLACDGKVIGMIDVMDTLRPDAHETIAMLQSSGIKQIILLSGDRQEITEDIARQLGIKKAYGQAFPEDKLKLLDTLQSSGNSVAMVGDGINDVAALKQANVGIAMGAMGMEPAIEAADIVLMTNELKNIYFVRKLSQQVFRVIKQNLVIGFLILHVLGVALTLMHLITPIQAAFFHAISDSIILLNASRLIGFNVKNNVHLKNRASARQ